jgi:hypothetical protein
MSKEFFFDDSLARYLAQDVGTASDDSCNLQPGKPAYRKPLMESFEPTVWGQTNFGCINTGCGGTNIGCQNTGCVL